MLSKMQMQYSLYLVIVLGGHVSTQAAETTLQPTFHFSDPVFTCSIFLARFIENICNNKYKIVKREASPFMDKLVPEDLQNHMRVRVFKTESWRRVRRQVATECCDRPCTIADVINYCPDDARVLLENPDIFQKL